MDTTAAVVQETKQSMEKPTSINRFIKDQLGVIFLVGLVSYGAYNYGEKIYNQAMEYIQTPLLNRPADGTTLEALQIIYDEIFNLRKETMEMREQFMEQLMTQKKTDEQKNVIPFKMQHFKEVFRMTPINQLEIDPKLKHHFDNYVLQEDPAYLESKAEFDRIAEDYGDLIGKSESNDPRFHVRWNNEKQEYCLYTSVHLPAYTFLGTFSGVITNHTIDLSTTWKYKGNLVDEDGERVELIVDGRNRGNWFHFLQIAENGNVEAFFIPHDNLWYIGFRTSRAVHSREELTLNRGDLD